jgi:hypothetical protein
MRYLSSRGNESENNIEVSRIATYGNCAFNHEEPQQVQLLLMLLM